MRVIRPLSTTRLTAAAAPLTSNRTPGISCIRAGVARKPGASDARASSAATLAAPENGIRKAGTTLGNIMNLVLWILQGLLGAIFLLFGVLKLVMRRLEL